MLLKHQNVENVEQFDKTMADILRQKKMQYLTDDMNYSMGFNHAWVALQGTVRENIIDTQAHKKLLDNVSQLKAENATLSDEVELLKKQLAEKDSAPKPAPKARAKPKPKAEPTADEKSVSN